MLKHLVGAISISEDGTSDGAERTSGAVDSTRTPPTDGPSGRSDEAVIRRLVAANGGRMFQQAIVAETEFSAATVSRLLGSMEAENQVGRYRKGQRKVVVLPEVYPNVSRYVPEDDE